MGHLAHLPDLRRREIADAEFQRALHGWEQQVERQRRKIAGQLARDPNRLAALGLPTNMPAESLDVLGRCQALDQLGPELPDRREFYARHNIQAP